MPPRTVPAVPEKEPIARDKSSGSVIRPPITVEDFAVKKLPRVVFAFDATGSRQPSWDAAKHLTDVLLAAMPSEVKVALAVHSGGRVEIFTDFTKDPGILRDQAAGVRCYSGGTQLLPILDRVARMRDCPVVVYIGDAYEEGSPRRVANALRDTETRVIILHEGQPPAAFKEIADLTGGALLPFDLSSLDQLGELLKAVAVLAVGGTDALEAQQETMPAATLLLENLSDRKLIGRR
jgi:hypothetical protein